MKETLLYRYYVPRLLILLSIFVFTGIALAFSLSYSFSLKIGKGLDGTFFMHSDILHLFTKQVIAAVIGIAGMCAILKMKTRFIRSISFMICVVGLGLMVFTALWGTSINGARRWLTIMGFSLQTGDFTRIAFILYISHIFAHLHTLTIRAGIEEDIVQTARQRLMTRSVAVSLLYIGSLYFQRDYSSLILSGTVLLLIVFSSDIRTRTKLMVFITMVVGVIFVVINNPNRMERIFTFFNPTKDVYDTGFQLAQSYGLIEQGGFFGRGIGAGMIESLSIPYFYNDFVFSIIIYEIGLVGVTVIMGLFFLLFWYAYKVCYILYYKNRFYFYVIFASIAFIVLSMLGHVAVTVGIAPTAGLNMPFYSTGGSSLLTTLLLYGFIIKGAAVADSAYATVPGIPAHTLKSTA